MSTAAVIHLQALNKGTIQGSTGRAVHGFWFEQWQRVFPAMATILHPSQRDCTPVQPFTLSPILGLPKPRKGRISIHQGDTAWVRITTLHEELTTPFLGQWLTQLPDCMTLAGIDWQIGAIALSANEHPWAGSWDELRGKQPLSTPPNCWMLDFMTPTSFHVGRNTYMPFPHPRSLIGSWCRRWQTFMNSPLPPLDPQLFQEQLLVSAYQLKTVPVRYGRRVTIGCVGKLTLRANKLPLEIRAAITTLAAYAFFCGSGYHTAQGMGMTRGSCLAID